MQYADIPNPLISKADLNDYCVEMNSGQSKSNSSHDRMNLLDR